MENIQEDQLNLSDLSDNNDINDPPRVSMINPLKHQYEVKQIKRRRYSLLLKSFKVSCPRKSHVLSLICDNIFEDVNIDQDNNNLSMINLFSKIKLNYNLDNNNDKEEKKHVKKESKMISNSKTFYKENKIINNLKINKDENLRAFHSHTKSYIFNNTLKLKSIKCPRVLEEQWIYEKILLDYNIIDFTSKK